MSKCLPNWSHVIQTHWEDGRARAESHFLLINNSLILLGCIDLWDETNEKNENTRMILKWLRYSLWEKLEKLERLESK